MSDESPTIDFDAFGWKKQTRVPLRQKLNPKRIWGKRADYLASALAVTARYSSPLIQPLENRFIRRFAADKQTWAPVFIVGAPRTGSTILYQVLTNVFDVLYMDNLSAPFRRNIYFGIALSNRLLGQGPHDCFSSRYGTTVRYGLNAPSEGAAPWEFWHSSETAYEDERRITAERRNAVSDALYAAMNRYGKPLVFKNLRAGQQIPYLLSIVPNARFVLVTRDPLYTAQSIYLARRGIGLPSLPFFATYPRNFKELIPLPEPERIVKQIWLMNRQIVRDTAKLGNDRVLHVRYEDLCEDLGRVVDKISNFLGPGVGRRSDAARPMLTTSQRIDLPDEILQAIREQVNRHDQSLHTALPGRDDCVS